MACSPHRKPGCQAEVALTAVAVDRLRSASLARWKPLLVWWAISRVVTLAAFLALDAFGRQGYLGLSLYHQPLDLLGAWDGVWYARVAQHGYLQVPEVQSDPAFFPLLPILLRAGRVLFHLPYVATGALVSNAALLVALVGFYELGCRVVGAEAALRAACFMAVTPMGFVFSMSYPESLALALTVLALLAAFDDRFGLAAALAATAVLARPEAAVLTVPLAALAWSHRRRLDPATRGLAVAAVLAAPAAVATFPLYLKWALNDAHAWGQAQATWGRSFALDGPYHAVRSLLRDTSSQPVLIRDAVFLVVYLALLVVAARKGVGIWWILGGALILAVPVFSGSFESEGRFGLFALPVYWAVAFLLRGRRAQLALRLGSLALLVAGVFALPWMWP